MLPIKQNKFVIIKRKQCTLWSKKCVSKKGCKIVKNKNILVWKKKIIIRKLRKCSVQNFSKRYKRTHCCRFTRICQNKKCKDISRGCFWTGRKILIEKTILRWKVICRDVPFGKKKKI